MKHGEQVYNTTCAACHQVSGEGLPNVFPALKGSKIATGACCPITSILFSTVKTAPRCRPSAPQMNDADLAAVITYERNSWGNNTGDVVQPSDIKAAR